MGRLGFRERTCECCGRRYRPKNGHGPRYCSRTCKGLSERRANFTTSELRKMVETMPITHIAKKFGVSDNAVRKWCRKRGIVINPRGYWQKLQAGKATKKKTEVKGDAYGVRTQTAFEKYRKLWGM